MTFWVATEIVLCSDLNTRVLCVKKFISIAKHCLILNNFNTAFEICSGLNLACISRLKQTWKNVPKKDFYTFEKLTQLFVPLMNYRTYRDTLASKQGPIVPYLGKTNQKKNATKEFIFLKKIILSCNFKRSLISRITQ